MPTFSANEEESQDSRMEVVRNDKTPKGKKEAKPDTTKDKNETPDTFSNS